MYENYLDKKVDDMIIYNPGLTRQIFQKMKNLLRHNKLVQYLYFNYIKGHCGYNKKQL